MAIEVKVKETTVLPMLSIRARTSLAEMGPHMQGAYGELFAYLGEMGLRPTGPPFSVYHDPEFREDDIDVETCVPVDRLVAGRGRVHGGRLPASPIAYTLHVGPYDEIGPAYQALAGWIQKHGHEMVGPPREVYLVGPDRAKEPSDYRTELQWPIR